MIFGDADPRRHRHAFAQRFPHLGFIEPLRNFLDMSELVFEVVQEADGGFCAEAAEYRQKCT
jgi:hypothetical protein